VLQTRREKISERLRTLQQLVPNGTKVDMVIMLEKAISYVKFLQLQVKVCASLNVYTEFCCIGPWNSDMIEPQVLATDEFWPVQGGMAPEISQVKEALDDILSSSPPSERGRLN
jgi:hypothetical protein